MQVVQISDMHVVAQGQLCGGRIDTAAALQRAVQHVLALPVRPDLVLATGDLSDAGSADAYRHLKQLLAPLSDAGLPLALLVGNHDDRPSLRAAFSGNPWLAALPGEPSAFLQYVIEPAQLGLADGPRIVVLDTLDPGHSGGLLCRHRLDWLAHTLAADSRPTVIALHHPPYACGIAFMDRIALDGGSAAALERLVSAHPQVMAIWNGHVHRPITTRFGGAVASTCPGTAHQIVLALDPDGPECWIREPPGYLLHRWHDGRWVTHQVPVGDFGPPQRYHE